MDYLRHRPFMVVSISHVPTKQSQTQLKNWADQKKGQWQAREKVDFVDRINGRHLSESTLIIDIIKTRVVMNRFTDTDETQVMEHYVSKYGKQLMQALAAWGENEANRTGKVAGSEVIQETLHNLKLNQPVTETPVQELETSEPEVELKEPTDANQV